MEEKREHVYFSNTCLEGNPTGKLVEKKRKPGGEHWGWTACCGNCFVILKKITLAKMLKGQEKERGLRRGGRVIIEKRKLRHLAARSRIKKRIRLYGIDNGTRRVERRTCGRGE